MKYLITRRDDPDGEAKELDLTMMHHADGTLAPEALQELLGLLSDEWIFTEVPE